jgi:hypothetical protein
MYGLPDSIDWSFLYKRTLESVCFVKHQLYLHLSDTCMISVESEMSIDKGGMEGLPGVLTPLHSLIDRSIVSASGTKEGTLSLTFEGGVTLHIHDSPKQYEAYCITLNGKEIVRV